MYVLVTINKEFRFSTSIKFVNKLSPCITDRGEGGLSALHGMALLYAQDSTVIYIAMNITGDGYMGRREGEGRIEGIETGCPLLVLCLIQRVFYWQICSNR
jgi:hypothetical protein